MRLAVYILLSFATLRGIAQSTFQSKLSCEAKTDYTVYGVVESKGKPLAGVAVSDGYEITQTDRQGRYYLKSQKRNGYVFVTSPGNYTYEVKDALPQLWANLKQPAGQAERHDFHLVKADHKRFSFIGLSDIHLANYYDAQQHLREKVMPVVNDAVGYIKKTYGKKNKIYTINCGDSSYDTYWVAGNYTIRDFPATLKDIRYPVPMFNVMGNHDNDPFQLEGEDVDFRAEQAFRDALGPTYYSFNIGAVHFVVMDNIIYNNKPGTTFAKVGLPGEKDFTVGFTANQMEWLRKDLELQDHSSPLVVCMHDPIYLRPKNDKQEYKHNFTDPENLKDFLKLVTTFSEIHFLDGHTHRNFTYRNDSLHIIDHNVSSICGNWWRTGFKGYDTYTIGRTRKGEKVYHEGHEQINPDGTPSGFYIFHVDGKKFTWQYQALSDPIDVQFRAFDMNEVRRYSQQSTGFADFIKAYPSRCDFRKVPDNQVWLNVWAWDPQWKVKVYEDGKEIPAKFALLENPEYVYWYNFFMTVDNDRFTSPSYNNVKHGMSFRIKCSSPTSTLDIEVTDPFGRTYRQTMKRPQAFDPNAKRKHYLGI